MRNSFLVSVFWLFSLYLLSQPLAANPTTALPFSDLLNEAGLVFNPPSNYSPVAVQQTGIFPYEYAIRGDDGKLEIRYSIRPLSRMRIDYEDPHNAAPEPNHIFTMMFTALIGELSNGGSSPHREYKQEQAVQLFNADWAAVSVFDIEGDYSADYQQAFLLALHKNNLSDAYLVVLFNQYDEVKSKLDKAFASLRFK